MKSQMKEEYPSRKTLKKMYRRTRRDEFNTKEKLQFIGNTIAGGAKKVFSRIIR